jgi:stage II sporulation protein B
MGGVKLDKQQANAIKIKINGEERKLKSVKQPKKKSDEKDQEGVSLDFPVLSWDEKVMAEKEVAASNAKKEDDFSWVLPEDDGEVFQDDPKVVAPKKASSKGKVSPYFGAGKKNPLSSYPFKQYAVTIILAIVLGVSFGFVALNFISNEDLPAAIQQAGAGAESDQAEAPANSKDEAAGSGESSADIQLYFTQIGKFSSKEGADTTVADMKSKGFPAIAVEEDGSYFVYGGVGNAKQETDGLSNVYQTSAIEPWSGKSAVFSMKTNEDASALINHFKSLVTLSSSAVTGQADDIDTKSDAILTDLNKLKLKDENLVAVKKELIDISKLLKEDVSEKTGWAAQQKLMDLLVSLK